MLISKFLMVFVVGTKVNQHIGDHEFTRYHQ